MSIQHTSEEARADLRRRRFTESIVNVILDKDKWTCRDGKGQDKTITPITDRLAEYERGLLRDVALAIHEAADVIETHDDYDDGVRQGYREAANIVDPNALEGQQ